MDKADDECIGDGHVMDNIKSSGIQSDSEVMGRSLALHPMKVNLILRSEERGEHYVTMQYY